MVCIVRSDPCNPASSQRRESPALRGPGTLLTAHRVCCDDDPCMMKAAAPRRSLHDPSLTQLAVPCLIATASASPSSSHFRNSTAHLADGGRFCRRSRRVVCMSSGGGGCIGLLFRTVTLVSWRLKIVVTLTDCGLICVIGLVRVDSAFGAGACDLCAGPATKVGQFAL